MKPSDFVKLEKDYTFKRSYLKNTPWWRNILLIAPSCILFVGLAGILFLLKSDNLLSLYIIPYLIAFVMGTIWLKAIKRHIQKTMMDIPGAFTICLAKTIGEKDGYVYTVFVNNAKRHDKYHITNLAKDLSPDTIPNDILCRKTSVPLQNAGNETDLYVRAYQTRDVSKRSTLWREDALFPVLFINEKYTLVIKKRDLNEAATNK